jgi:hypothetical protein
MVFFITAQSSKPRFQRKREKKIRVHTRPVYTKVSWLEGCSFIGLPGRPVAVLGTLVPLMKSSLLQLRVSGGFGTTGTSVPVPHPTSFEVYS